MSCQIWPEPNDLQLSTFPFHPFTPPWRVQHGETPLQDCPAPGRRPSVLSPQSSVLCLHPFTPSYFLPFPLPLLLPLQDAASGCHFSLPFGKTKSLCVTIPPTNCRSRRNRGVEIDLSLFTVHCSLSCYHLLSQRI